MGAHELSTPLSGLSPAPLLKEHRHLFTQTPLHGPVLDLACGEGHNGIFLALQSFPVILCDLSDAALTRAGILAKQVGAPITRVRVDLEKGGAAVLRPDGFGAILVFRYLHRPLLPAIKRALTHGGLLFYETYTERQPRFGKPHNPEFLLKQGELRHWFSGWEVIHHFEGIKKDPERAIAQIVCRKP